MENRYCMIEVHIWGSILEVPLLEAVMNPLRMYERPQAGLYQLRVLIWDGAFAPTPTRTLPPIGVL